MKKLILTIFLCVLMLSAQHPLKFLVHSGDDRTLNDVLKKYKIAFETGGTFDVIKNFKYPSREKTFQTIIAKNNKTRIEIEIVKPLQATELMKFSESRYIIINSLFEPQVIPYSGALTHTSACPKNKMPIKILVEILEKPVNVLLVNATERYVLGVCKESMIKNKAAFSVLRDGENKTLYQIIIFQPTDSFDRNGVLEILTNIKHI